VPIGCSHFGLSWLRLLGVVAGVLVRPRARRRAGTREQDRVSPLFMAFVRLNDSVPWRPDKFVQCYERLAPYLACLSVDGRRAYGEREEGLHPVGPGQQPTRVPRQFVEPRSVPGHPRSPGAQVGQGVGRPDRVRPACEHGQKLDRHLDQRAAGRRGQFYVCDALCKVSKLLCGGPPVASWPGTIFTRARGKPALSTRRTGRRTTSFTEPAP
jgi:hypothetical protein